MTYVSVSQEQLGEALQQGLEGKVPDSAAGRVVGRQVHLIYRKFGQGGRFYLRDQDREKTGGRSISHDGFRRILQEGAAGFLDAAQSIHLAESQMRELTFRFGRTGHYYLARGRRDTAIPELAQRQIYRAWFLGGEDSRSEILNAYCVSTTTLDAIIARGQAEGWMRV